jgi:acyl-CoA thioester hydrolase
VAAFTTTGTRILPEWIDYNGHMMDGYYLVAFSDATEGVLQALGFGSAYRERTGCTIYTVEGHLTYIHEVAGGEPVRFETLIADHDAKRIHVVHEMQHAETGERLAVAELMFLHVCQESRTVEPMPAEQAARVATMAADHADLARPRELGRSIGMRRR